MSCGKGFENILIPFEQRLSKKIAYVVLLNVHKIFKKGKTNMFYIDATRTWYNKTRFQYQFTCKFYLVDKFVDIFGDNCYNIVGSLCIL